MAKQDDEQVVSGQSGGEGRPHLPLTNSDITYPLDRSDPNTDVLEEINARLADCSMSSVVDDGLVLNDDEVDRLVAYEALPSLVTNNSSANSGDNTDNGQAIDDMFRDMSIVNDQRRYSAAAVSSAPSVPPSALLDSPLVTTPHGHRHDPILGQARQHRPFDEVAEAGPPLNPVPFPPPKYSPARRVKRVLCYNEHTEDFFFASNVLIRLGDSENVDDSTGSTCSHDEDGDLSLHNVDRAYWKMPHKATIETRMGHLEKCHVLRRMDKSSGGMDDSSEVDSDSSGSDGDVVFVLTDECVAVKVNYCDRMQRLADTSPHSGENPLVEIAALQMVGTKNSHVLGSIEALYDGQTLSVVLPYCDGGDLHDLVVEHQMKAGTRYGLPEEEARRWFRQLLAGLHHLQSMDVCHRDLSPENLIVKDGKALIIDMGMCMQIPVFEEEITGSTESTPRRKRRRLLLPQGVVGKLPYMSPETYRNTEPFDGFAIDMWTAGTTLFFLLSGAKYEHPFDPIFEAMTRDLAGLLPHWGIDYLSPQCIDLMQRLITIDPRHRLTLEEALAHPWLRDVALS